MRLTTLLLAFSIPWFTPTKPITAPVDPYQSEAFRKAFFDAAKVYGKAGCGDMQLAESTAHNAIRTGLPANLIASVVAVESTCNPLAVSNKGDVGLMQINIRAQSDKYDFKTLNLFNPEISLQVGSDILASMVKTYGMHKGISHYNGAGPETEVYAAKVLSLSGKLPTDGTPKTKTQAEKPEHRVVQMVPMHPAPKIHQEFDPVVTVELGDE